MKRRSVIAVLGSLLLGVGNAGAQTAYPERPVTIIVPFAAGGQTDAAARILAEGLQKELGKPFIVDNRTGAGGIVGTQAVAAARPDGYTLVIGGPSTLVTQPLLMKSANYDVKKNFVPVAMFAAAPMLLVVNADSEFKSLGGLIEAGRSRELTYGSSGVGSSMHLGTEWFKGLTGIRALHVPFRGSSQSLPALLSRDIDFLIDPPITALPLVEEGKLRALAVTARTSDPKLAGIPTMSDAGARGYEQLIWNSLMAPAGTPSEILDKLDQAVRKVLADPQVSARLQSLSLPAEYRHRDAFAGFLDQESAQYAKIIQDNHIVIK